jgi:hypothetical protein
MGVLLMYENIFGIVAIGFMATLLFFGIIEQIRHFKFIRYVQEKYPELAKELGFPNDGWFNGFKYQKAIYKREFSVDDPVFWQYLGKARKFHSISIWLILLPVFVFLILMVICLLKK